MSDRHKEAVEKYAHRILNWLRDNSLMLTHENIRRYFGLYFPKAEISEKSIEELYNRIGEIKK